MLRVAVDVGGTFTDLAYVNIFQNDTQGFGTAKIETTPPDYEKGIVDVFNVAKLDAEAVNFFAHGTTVIINAITERKGAVTALITTEGFRDVLEIARGNRPDFFNLDYRKPKPFVPRFLRREIPERVSYRGEVLKPVNLSGLPGILEDFRSEGVGAIAICLLNSYANPEHEYLVYAEIRKNWPDVAVVMSCQITREWREYERTNTAVLSAYVQPAAGNYLDRLEDSFSNIAAKGNFYIMQSNCGVDTLNTAREIPITMVESGPASGVWGAAALGGIIGESNIISLDIGGTTAKCSLISEGRVKINTDYTIGRSAVSAGYPVMVPVVDLVEIGNGGGSIAWVDPYQKLHVGPQSTGAVPGPASYGKGGTEATTTDANLELRRINPDYFRGGFLPADMDSVNSCLDSLASKMKCSRREAAKGVVRIANNNMVNALKLVSVNRGYDPRDFVLIAFGGGGGMHACELAVEMGVKKVVIPKQSAIFSAWGMLMTDLRRDYVRTHVVELDQKQAADQLNDDITELEKKALAEYSLESIDSHRIEIQRFAHFRYQNQAHSVEMILCGGRIDAGQIRDIQNQFHAEYERQFTYQLDAPVEIVGFHIVAIAHIGKLIPATVKNTGRSVAEAKKIPRDVDFADAGVHKSTIFDGELLEPGMVFSGPAIVEEPGDTIVAMPNMPCSVDEYGNIHIQTG